MIRACLLPWSPGTTRTTSTINADPYPTYRRLREEAPLYYNEQHDFYALSRYEDVERALVDRETFISGRGGDPRADPGQHRDAARRRSSSRTRRSTPSTAACCRGCSRPKQMARSSRRSASSAPQCLDPLVGTGGFDFIADLGAQMPMRVIGMLLGIPEQDQEAIRDRVDANLRTEAGKPMEVDAERLRRAARCSPSTSTGGPSTRPTTS